MYVHAWIGACIYHALFLMLQCHVIVGLAKPLGIDPSIVGSEHQPHGGEATVKGHTWLFIFLIIVIIRSRLFLIILQKG